MSDDLTNHFADRASQLKRNTDSLVKMAKLYDRLSLDRTANYFNQVDTLRKIETLRPQIESISAVLKLDEWLTEEKKHLAEVEGRLTYDFGRLLADLLSKSDLHMEGNFPEFKIKMFLLEVNMRSANCQLWYGYREEFIVSIPLKAESASKAISSAYNRIAKRSFDESTFLSSLLRAYEAAVRKQQKQAGDQIGIIDALVEFNFQRQNQKFLANPRKSTFQEYPREHFSYDLFRLRQREVNGLALNLGIASRDQNRHRESYLWIPSDESLQGNVYAELSFRRMK